MCMFGNLKAGIVFVCQGRHGDAALWIVIAKNRILSHRRYIMAQYYSCANKDFGS